MIFGAAALLILVAIGAAGVWAAIYFGRPPVTEQAKEEPPEPPEPRLIGTWLVDSDATISEIRTTRRISDEEELAMRRQYRTVVKFLPTMMTIRFSGQAEPQPYEMVSKDDSNSIVVIKTFFRATNKDEEVKIRFVGNDTFFLEIPQLSLKQWFRRID
jgi:hypothetical protein